MLNYIAVIHKDSDSDYSVSFPDIPGCITAGKTIDEAKNMAQEALELHIEGLLEDKEILPKESSLEKITNDPQYKSASAFFVSSAHDVKKHKVKFNATMDEILLQKLDIVAKQVGKSRSEFLSDGARILIKEYQH